MTTAATKLTARVGPMILVFAVLLLTQRVSWAATYTSPRQLILNDVYQLNVDSATGDEATTLPKTDANDGLNGDNPYFQRTNVARAHLGGCPERYWYTSSYQEPGEPDPAGTQWVDYAPPFGFGANELTPGQYQINAQYRYSASRATYAVQYVVHHANGTTTINKSQRDGTLDACESFDLGSYNLAAGSYIRVIDTGPQSITFNRMLFSYRGASGVGLLNTPPSSVTTFRVYELALGAASPGSNPYTAGPSVTAVFTGTSGEANGRVLAMKGFWDGGNVWRIRFAATAQGNWSWVTSSSDTGLNGVSGSVTAVAPTPAELSMNTLYHGFLQRSGYAWQLSDGSGFLPVGDTHWAFSEESTTSEWQAWMSARQTQNFNTFLGCVWLGIYSRSGVPEAFPGKNPQTDTPDMAYFLRLDQMVQYANDHGIMMGLTLGGFPDNSDWWNKMGTQARDDRWFRYCVSRYTAYNVRWCLYGEVNERNPSWGTWQSEVSHKAQLVKDEDPYDHPIGSHHNSVDTSSANHASIDYIEVQDGTPRSETQYQNALSYRQYGKPVWYEEYWYEPATYDNEYTKGIRNTHRNFVAAMAFPTMGSLMRAHYPDFNINDVGTDPGAIRMGYFADFYKNLTMADFTPSNNLVSAGQCGKFGNDYAIFEQAGGSFTINLTGVSGDFNVTRMDINSGVTASLGSIAGNGTRTINTGTSNDVAVLVTKTGPVTNTAPSVSAGPDQTIELGQVAFLDATVTDDGLPNPPSAVTTTWSMISGPGAPSFGSPAAVDTTVTLSTTGVYVLMLTAGDSELQTSDEVTITVKSNVPGDADDDGDVDAEDFGSLQSCLTGSGVLQTDPACQFADLTNGGDGDVDQDDVMLFLGCLSGPNIQGDPGCAG